MARLTDAQQDVVLMKRFHLMPAEIECARKFRDFGRRLLNIDFHVGQLAFAAVVLVRHPASPSTARYLTLFLSSGNRAGKTMLLACLIIYSCLTKLNRPNLTAESTEEQADRHRKLEYHWYHFGIAQEVADLVFNEIVRILSGNHEAQGGRGCPLTKNGPVATWDVKEYGDYRWIRFGAEWGGAEVHFRTTGEKALGSLGKDMHGISFDEAGIERNLDFLITEVFNLRRLGTGGQFLAASTPSEDLGTTFADNWEQGNPANRDRLVSWCSLRMSTRDNVGYGITEEMFDRLIADMDERTIRQNIDGEFLQAKAAYFNGANVERVFTRGLPERIGPAPSGVYLQGIDPAKTDGAWSIILKISPNSDDPARPFLVGVHCDFRRGQKSVETLVSMAAAGYDAYEGGARARRVKARCYTALDATGFGGKMFRELLEVEVPNITNVEFGGTIQRKRKLLGDLRTIIDEGRLILPKSGDWMAVRRQLLGYKQEDRDIEQDAVMALVCAVHILRRTPTGGVIVSDFDLYGIEGNPPIVSPAEELASARMAARARNG